MNVRDREDFYKFTLNQTSAFNLSLSGVTTDADVYLIRDSDNNDEIDAGDIIAASTHAKGDETIALNLAAGNYIIEVFDALGDTSYDIDLSATATTQDPTLITPPVGTTLQTANAQASPTFTTSGNVSDTTQSNFYKFTVNDSGIFTANLTGLTGDADVRLIRDYNNNGLIDPVVDRNKNLYLDKDEVEIVAWQPNRDASNESIRAFLESGDYFLEVNSPKKATTNYNVSTTFSAAATDPLAFKINVNFTDAAKSALSVKHPNGQTLQQTVEAAADYWSRVISYSSFDNKAHTINVEINAENLGEGTLASAGARYYTPIEHNSKDAKGKYMPTMGKAKINTKNILDEYQSDVRYLYETMIHEFGHVIGLIGKETKQKSSPFSWNNRDLLDFSNPNDPLYKANTFTGIAYGELLGTNKPTALPVTRGEGEGSDYSHWWKKVFGEEAQVESGQAGKPALFSIISIASARDLGYNVNYGAAEPYTVPKAKA